MVAGDTRTKEAEKSPADALKERATKEHMVEKCVEALVRDMTHMRRAFIEKYGKEVGEKYYPAVLETEVGRFANLAVTELCVRRMERRFREKGGLDAGDKLVLDVAKGFRDIAKQEATNMVSSAVDDFLKKNSGMSLSSKAHITEDDFKAFDSISKKFSDRPSG